MVPVIIWKPSRCLFICLSTFLSLSPPTVVCVCVCMCVHMCVCVRVCVYIFLSIAVDRSNLCKQEELTNYISQAENQKHQEVTPQAH